MRALAPLCTMKHAKASTRVYERMMFQRAVNERYLALPGKHNFVGVGFSAARLITPELRSRLAARSFEPVKNTK